jgi:hypothetical protein
MTTVRQEGTMLVTQGTAQEMETARAGLILLALAIAIFWRVALRILLAIMLVVVSAGAFVLLQGMHW